MLKNNKDSFNPHNPSHVQQIEQQTALKLFENGGVFLIIDMPEGSQFGIDHNTFQTGPKFRGVKMIPPGVHFIHFGAVNKEGNPAPKIGFFHNFVQKELHLRKYDSKIEDLTNDVCDPDEVERYRVNLKSLDEFLAPYPFENIRAWFSLSCHITASLVERLQPLKNRGRISSQCSLVTKEMELGESSVVNRSHRVRTRYSDADGLPIMKLEEGTEIRFTTVPARRVDSVQSQFGMDSTAVLESMLRQYDEDVNILGELQFAFVCFLIGQDLSGFEQWKQIVHLMCSCTRALASHEQLFLNLMSTLYFHLKETPREFFEDIVENNNILVFNFTNFFAALESCDAASLNLKEKGLKFKHYLEERYEWNFDEESDDYLPVVVESPVV